MDGQKKIEDATLVALTIMIAESRPEEKEMMISVIMNCMLLMNERKKQSFHPLLLSDTVDESNQIIMIWSETLSVYVYDDTSFA